MPFCLWESGNYPISPGGRQTKARPKGFASWGRKRNKKGENGSVMEGSRKKRSHGALKIREGTPEGDCDARVVA